MSRQIWIVMGVAVLLIGILTVVLGLNLVTPMAEAQERGTIAGWWLVWTVIAVSVISAGALGAFLLAAGMGRVPETRA